MSAITVMLSAFTTISSLHTRSLASVGRSANGDSRLRARGGTEPDHFQTWIDYGDTAIRDAASKWAIHFGLETVSRHFAIFFRCLLDLACEVPRLLKHHVPLLIESDDVVTVLKHDCLNASGQPALQILSIAEAGAIIFTRMQDQRGLANS